jgi:hypothetical protein
MSNAINIANLQRAAEKYDDTLRMLPYLALTPTLDKLGINFLQVDEKDKVVVYHRKGGLAKPYVVGGENLVNEGEIGKVIERILEPKECYTALKDHIMNYRSKRVISNKPEKIDNRGKKHPLEVQIIDTKIKTVGEDILSALFFGTRNEDDKSPMGMFDGFNAQIDKEIVAGELATAKANLCETGSLDTPADDTDMEAFDKLVAFIRSANPFLRHNGVLYITQPALFNAMDALGNKLKYKNALEWEVFVNHLRGITGAPKLQIISDPVLGTGSRLILTVPDNLDFGLGTLGDEQFVQVRSPYEDPNVAQFWMQWSSGTRIVSIHPKTFLVNDQTNTGADLYGDYS